MNESYELLIQRLVDNELDEAGRVEFLRTAEAHQELWRQTALAFVEDRIWSSVVLRQSDKTACRPHGAGTGKVSIGGPGPWWRRYGPPLMMTAAAVFLVFSLALRFNPATPAGLPQTPPAVAGGFAGSGSDTTAGPGQRLASQPLSLQVEDGLEVPIYEDRELFREELKRWFRLDPRLVQRFEQAGLQLQPEISYLTGSSQDGRPLIVPIQRFYVTNIGQ
jgi:hypothetical protein